jgi:ABC-type proline/glycine betaine transport system substrate-binding protein
VKFLIFWFMTSCSVAGASATLATTSKSVRYHIPPYKGTEWIVGVQKKVMKDVSAKVSPVTP